MAHAVSDRNIGITCRQKSLRKRSIKLITGRGIPQMLGRVIGEIG